MALVLAAAAVAYYSATRHRDTARPQPSESVTPAARYLSMPDFCGYLQLNQFRGRQEMTASELGADSADSVVRANTSTQATCGWESPSSSSTGFKMTLSAKLMSKEEAAKRMASIKLGRSKIDVAWTASEVEEIGDEAKQAVDDEDILKRGKTGRLNSTTVWFRREGLFVTVSYMEFGLPLAQDNAKDMVTERARQFARSLDGFLKGEPENHEKPIWG
jgi:hypothetical protein